MFVQWSQQPSPSSSALERYQLDALIEEARKARKDMRSAQERESALQTANTKLRLSKVIAIIIFQLNLNIFFVAKNQHYSHLKKKI